MIASRTMHYSYTSKVVVDARGVPVSGWLVVMSQKLAPAYSFLGPASSGTRS